MPDFHIVGDTVGLKIGEQMTQAIGKPLREVVETQIGAETYNITDDAGDGTPHGDLNATDFTSQTGTTYLEIKKSVVYNFVHKLVLYQWVGPKDVTVGVGGNYSAGASDLVGQGTADHDLLVNRHSPTAHETADINGLDVKQQAQDDATTAVDNDLQAHKTASYAHQIIHIEGLTEEQARQDQDLVDHRTETDAHPTSSITGLDAKQLAQDQAHTDHLNDTSDGCHDQYATEVAALNTFALAGYGGILSNGTVAMPDLDSGWVLFDAWNAASMASPRYVTQDFANNGLRFERIGVFSMNIKLSIAHNSSNGGRILYLRFNNGTTGTPATNTFAFGVGRNVEATNLIIPGALFDIPSNVVGDLVQLEIGGGDSFSSVDSIGASFEAFSVSEAKGLEEA